MMAWMVFAAAVAALAGAAALAAERALRLLRLPTRGAWVAALAASLVLPFALPRPARMESGVQAIGAIQQAPGDALAGDAVRFVDPSTAPTSSLPAIRDRVETALPWAWGACTLAMAAALAVAALRLARRRRAWLVETVAGETVLVSPSVGPAVVGFVRPRIVMPRWTLGWAEPLQRLMLRHEREHVRAGDPLLLLAGLVAVALMPWSPALWWQLRRLRLAMEVDCDARTLRDTGDVRAYGRLLLEIGRLGGAGAPVPLVSFSEPRSFLERRIDVMTMRVPPHRRRLVLAWTALAGVAAVSLAALPAPARVPLIPVRAASPAAAPATLAPAVAARRAAPAAHSSTLTVPADAPRPAETAAAANAATVQDTSRVWALSEVDRAPVMTNTGAVGRLIDRTYPPLLRDAGIRGEVEVELVVGTDGVPRNATVLRATHEAFAQAAITVVNGARFRPGVKDGRAVRVRVRLPITMRSSPASSSVQPAGSADDVTAMQDREARIRRELAARYPGVAAGGTTGREYVWFVADPAGTVRQSGTGTIEAASGWDSAELEAQMRRRIPGIDPMTLFLGEVRTAENGPTANVAWITAR
ncbi:MAG TPA: M56 family metallopeptidase [Longimicrobium sp.]|jgi:TonB family protein